MEKQKFEGDGLSGCAGMGCAVAAGLLIFAPILLLGYTFYSIYPKEKAESFLANFKSKERNKNYFIGELEQKNKDYELTLNALKNGGYMKVAEPNPITNWNSVEFFYEMNDSEKQKHVKKLYNLKKSKKNIERKLCNLI